MHSTVTTRSSLAHMVMVVTSCLVSVGGQTAHAAPPKAVGINITNSVKSNLPAYMELRVNGKIIAVGHVGYHRGLWGGFVPKGSSVRLTVQWNGKIKHKTITVTRHGTYFGPAGPTKKGGFTFVYTPQN